MDESTRDLLRAAEEAVGRLVEACRKEGTLYRHNPRAVAQVSRTSKWLLNTTAALRKALDPPCADNEKQSS